MMQYERVRSREIVNTAKWRVRQYLEDDKPSLLRLSALHYGDKELATEAYVDWLYSGSPAGRPLAVVAEDSSSGEIIGFLWHIPLNANFQGKPVRCYLACNGLMHPRSRRQGVYIALQDLAAKSFEGCVFKYGFAKPLAFVPLTRVGNFMVSLMPLLVRPLDIARLTQTRLGNPVWRVAINAGWQIAGSTIWRPPRALAQSSQIRVSQESAFDESFDDLWKRVEHKYDIVVARDRAFLNWRFCNLSFRSYTILSARLDGDLVGYTVLRCHDIQGVPTGLIMDLLAEPTARGEEGGLLLLEEATRLLQKSGMVLAGGLMLRHTQEYGLLRRAGYIECPAPVAPQPFRLNTRSLSPSAPNEILAQSDRWFMTMANHDAV